MQCASTGKSLLAFTSGFALSSVPRHIHVSSFLVPSLQSVTHTDTSSRSCCVRRPIHRRKFATRVTLCRTPEQHNVGREQQSGISQDAGSEKSTPRPGPHVSAGNTTAKRVPARMRQERIIATLDPYLPLELRSKSWLENLTDFQGVRDAVTLPEILLSGKQELRSNLLSFLAIRQGRWDALHFLVESLLNIKSRGTSDEGFFDALVEKSPWSNASLPPNLLDDLTTDPIEIGVYSDRNTRRLPPFDSFVDSFIGNDEIDKYQVGLGEIWECLGDVLVQLARGSMGKESDVLPHIHRVLGQMHSVDAVPKDIYQYDPVEVPLKRRKPPFLHAMSSRIMAVISESVWRSVEHDTIKNSALDTLTYARKGNELPGSRLSPRVRPLGLEVWIEFVLWSCFHGGYCAVASKILSQIAQIKDPRWSLAPWQQIEKVAMEKANQDREAFEASSWFLRLSSSLEGYSQEPSIVAMPPRTLSREVVLALFDSATALDSDEDARKVYLIAEAYRQMTHHLESLSDDLGCNAALASLFSRQQYQKLLPEGLLALFAKKDHPSQTKPKATHNPHHDGIAENHYGELNASRASMYTSNATTHHDIPRSQSSRMVPTALDKDFTSELGNPWHGAALASFIHAVDDSKITSALSQFSQLQDLVDKERLMAINTFTPDHPSDAEHAEASARQTQLQVPHSSLAAFLDIVTRAKLLDLATWLVHSKDPDGTLIPSFAPQDPIYQPALLRFAAATSDYPLIAAVTESLSVSLSEFSSDILRSLFACQIKLHKFDSAADTLSYMSRERAVALSEDDIVDLICTYIQLKTRDPRNDNLYPMRDFLVQILSAKFVPPRNPAKPFDYRAYRVVQQLCRICASLPRTISELAVPLLNTSGPAASPTFIQTPAFNALVRQVRESFGISDAYMLIETWCHGVGDAQNLGARYDKDIFVRFGEKDERVVNPNVETIRILFEGVSRDPFGIEKSRAGNPDSVRDDVACGEGSVVGDEDRAVVVENDILQGRDVVAPELVDWAKTVLRNMGLNDAAIEEALSIKSADDAEQVD